MEASKNELNCILPLIGKSQWNWQIVYGTLKKAT